MMVKLETLLVGAVASFEAVSAASVAGRQLLHELPGASEAIQGRLQGGARLGDQCHPIGTYTLGGGELIPPCIAEQAIALKCEALTAPGRAGANGTSPEQRAAYKSCLSGQGASYFQDVKGCLACKQSHGFLSDQQAKFLTDRYTEAEADFSRAANSSQTVWDIVSGRIGGHRCLDRTTGREINDWPCYNQLDQPSGIAAKNTTAKEYYVNAPASQNIGQFTLNGTQYPEVGEGATLSQALVDVYEVVSDISYVYDVRVSGDQRNVSSKFESHTQVKISQQFSQIKNLFNFTKPDTFTIVSTISAPVPIANSTREVPAEKAAAVQLPACNKCSAIAVSLEDSRNMAAVGIKPAPQPVVDAAKPVMEGLEKNDPSEVMKASVALIAKVVSEFIAEVSQVVNQPSSDTGNRPTPETGKRPSSEAVKRPSADIGDCPSPETGGRPSPEIGNRPSAETGNRPSSETGKLPASAGPSKDQQPKDASPGAHNQAGFAAGKLKITICQVDEPNNCREAIV